MRHNDFSRYRAYCARKLYRLRRGRLIRLSHSAGGGGGGRRKGGGDALKWRPLPLSAASAREPRHLQLLLFQAERAWAYAQELRAAGARAARRARASARLRRAAKWADALRALCAARGDARTQLEAEAYAAWMRGQVALEAGAWADAQVALELAQRVYGELGRVAAKRVKELYVARVADIEPNLKLTRYNLARRGARGGGSGGAAAAAASGGGGGGGALADQVAAALQESAGATADGVSSVAWRGSLVPVRSEKLRGLLGAVVERAAALPAALAAGGGGGEVAYLETLTKLDDVVRVCEADAARAGREGGQELLVTDLKALAVYARFVKLRCALERLLAGARAAEGSLASAEAGGVGGGGSAPAEDAVAPPPLVLRGPFSRSVLHGALEGSAGAVGANAPAAGTAGAVASLYARAAGTVDDMLALVGEEEALEKMLRARRGALLAARAWYQSLAYLYGGRLSDAAALMGRADSRAGDARAAFAAAVASAGVPLPATGAPPGAGAPAAPWTAAVVLTGASAGDEARVAALGAAISARRAAITAGGLLQAVAPDARADAAAVALYARGLKGGRALVRSARAAPLIERGACGGGLYAAGALLEPALDGGGLLTPPDAARNGAAPPHIPGLLPVPFKPVLFDLAGMDVAYNLDALKALAK